MKEIKDIRFTVKNVKLRTVAFVIAFVIAVGAFAVGIASFGKRESGYYAVTPDPSGDALFFASGIDLSCYFKGTSREVRQQQTQARLAYSPALLRWFKLLDANTTYADLVNLASVNEAPGTWVALPDDLYAVVEDAQRLAAAYPQVSVTAGALYAEWNTILSLTDPADSDPLLNADEAARIEKIAAALREPDAVRLEFDRAGKAVRLTKSAAYQRLETELELSADVLDLGLLHDAYLLARTAKEIEENGVRRGVLSSQSGLCLSLSDTETGEFALKSLADDGEESVLETVSLPGGAAAAQCRSYPAEGDVVGYYRVTADGKEAFRSPWVDAETGEIPDGLLCSYAVGSLSEVSLPELVCGAMELFASDQPTQSGNRPAAARFAVERSDPGTLLRCGGDPIA